MAQIPVTDAGNLLQNTFQTVQQLLMVISWGFDLAAIVNGSDGGGEGFNEDLQLLALLVNDARQIGWDINSLEQQLSSLLSIDHAPSNASDLAGRSAQMRRVVAEGYSYAMRVQTLIATTQRTIKHILRTTERIAEVIGGVSGHQNGQEYLAKLTQLQTQQAVIATSFERAQSVEKMDDPIVVEAVERIKANVRVDMPR